jgi:Ribonuclease G/E
MYSTAITRLLLDNGFEVAQPSLAIKERFKLDENAKSPDIDIYDRYSRQGVHAVGTAESLEALKTILQHSLMDVIFRKQPFPIDGIYRGVIRDSEEAGHFVSVDVGPVVGKLHRNEVHFNKSNSVIVQVQRRKTLTNEPVLSTKVSVPGKYAVVIPERKIKVSLKIRDVQKRMSLIELGKKLAPPEWGIIWRTTAATQPVKVLEREILHLTEVWKKILKETEEETAPALLWGNQHYMNVEFPALSKASLDKVRAQVTPTISGHHYYKACGKAVSAALEMAEKMLESSASREEVERLFRQTVEAEYAAEGFFISIEHVKPNGNVYHLGKARIEKCDDSELVYSRVFKNEGLYDSLGAPKEPGDRAVTQAKVGEWYYTTRYYSKNGVYKGAHVNLNTPLELYPRWIRYVDLEVDVCTLPDGTVKVVDEAELEQGVADGSINEKLAAVVKEKVAEILESSEKLSASEDKPREE